MKKTLCIILAVFMLFSFSGCGKEVKDAIGSSDAAETKKDDPEKKEIDAFFEKYIETDERPIAIMVDNDDKNARPHAGLNDAYLIYEIVVEGGATRFIAFFKGTDTEKIGPVRSSRHYFLDYCLENDAIYTHYGWSPQAIKDIAAFNIDKINGVLGSDGNIFWREQKFKGDWHSAYTSIAKIKEMAASKGYELTTKEKNGIKYNKSYLFLPFENVAGNISLSYSGLYKTGYNYNADTGLYEKTINSAPHVMQSGEVLSAKNVIVLFNLDTSLGDGTDRRNLNTVGTGSGIYFTNGSYKKIIWNKSSRTADTTYTYEDGEKVYINPGKTIINIISSPESLAIG